MGDWASLVAQMAKNLPAVKETQLPPLDWEDPPEKGMATHSGTFAWRISWTEEPDGLQSIGSQSDTTEPSTAEADLAGPIIVSDEGDID